MAVVDDDRDVLDSIQLLFRLEGIAVRLYDSAADFLADWRDAPAGCLILDQHMPGMTGLELAAALRDDGAHVPILLVTGAPGAAILRQAASLGIEDVLGKPPDEHDLLRFARRHTETPGIGC